MPELKSANNNIHRIDVLRVPFTLNDFTTGVATQAVTLPLNAVVVGGYLTTSVVWNSGNTDDTLTVSGGGCSTGTIVCDSALITPLAGVLITTDAVQSARDTIDITWVGTGTAATTGAGVLIVEYIIEHSKEN